MKNIEQLIKESLENHELPFNEAAWDSMSKRLDGSTPTPFYRKWWVLASLGTALVGSALFFALQNQSNHKKIDSQKSSSTTTIAANKSQNKSTASTKNDATVQHANSNSHAETHVNTTHTTTVTNGNVTTDKFENRQYESHSQSTNEHTSSIPQSVEKEVKTSPAPNLLPVQIAKTTVCLGENIVLVNPNQAEIFVSIDGAKTRLSKKETYSYTVSQEGTIEIVSGTSKQLVSVVKPIDRLYISVDESLIYSEGIPSLEFEIAGNDNSIKWTVENHPFEVVKNKLFVHPYQGQTVEVKATSKDLNGCTISETKKIELDEAYNLQAVTGFKPNSDDPRTNRFMPYALTQRNCAFELTIFDSKTGNILYKTNDATAGWDGKNNQTGEVLKPGTSSLWKVVLKDPNPGEPIEYKGVITISE